MMSKKTKAMEQQLTQLAQENDALRAQLAAAGVEIENVKSELAKTVGERDRFRNELNGAQTPLGRFQAASGSNCERSYRSTQHA